MKPYHEVIASMLARARQGALTRAMGQRPCLWGDHSAPAMLTNAGRCPSCKAAL